MTQAKSNLHGDTKLQQDKDTAKRTIAQLQNLNDAQKGLEDTMIDGESTRTQVQHDLAEAQALNGLMGTLKESIKIIQQLLVMVTTSMLIQLKTSI